MYSTFTCLCFTFVFILPTTELQDISATQCEPTSPATEGPYFLPNAPTSNRLVCKKTREAHQRLLLHGLILDASDCSTPLPSKVEIWQANLMGEYSGFQQQNDKYDCRVTMRTDKLGRFFMETMFPGRYMIDKRVANSFRPAHVHFKITPDDTSYRVLTTQLYFRNDKYLYPNDYCGSLYCRSNESSLIIPVTNINDVKTFQGQWSVFMKPLGNGDVDTDNALLFNI